MSVIVIGMIIAIIVLSVNNHNLKEELYELKQSISKKINFCPKCGADYRAYNGVIKFCTKCGFNFLNPPPISQVSNVIVQAPQENRVVIEKEKHSDKEIKNSLILTIGSILIVLSAIVFLASTWKITHNVVKTAVISLMLIIFFGISNIAEKKLNLKQTSKTFYYIALIYIPIVLLSISLFSLFGHYLSLYGEGKYIYLMLSSILVSIIYYFVSKRKNNSTIFVFSFIFQLLTIIFLVLIFTNNFSAIMLGLISYIIVIDLLYVFNKFYFNKNIHLRLINVFNIAFISLIIFTSLFKINITVLEIINLIVSLVSLYIFLIKIWNKYKVYQYLYPLFIIFTFTSFSRLFENSMFSQALVLSSFATIVLCDIFKYHRINIISYVEILITFSLFGIFWLIQGSVDVVLLDAYIIFGIISLISLINYIYDGKYKQFSSFTFIINLMIFIISIIARLELEITYVEIAGLIFTLIGMYVSKLEISLQKALKIVGVITFSLFTLFVVIDDTYVIYDILIYLVYFGLCFIYSLENKNNFFKILSYIYINIFLLSLDNYFDLYYSMYIIPVTTILITAVEKLLPAIKTKGSEIYLLIQYIFSLFLLNSIYDIPAFVLLLGINVLFVLYLIYYKKNKNLLYLTFISMIPYIYTSNLLYIENFNFAYIISLVAIGYLILSIYKKKDNLYISNFYIYTFFHIVNLEEEKYVSILILLVGTLFVYLIKNNKVKDFYKALLYLFSLILYNFIIDDINLSGITIFSNGIYIVFTLLLTRTIFIKYGSGYKAWEYILSILINFITLSSYSNEYDGILYVIFLIIVVAISYVYKFGPMFLICLISILINILLLTMEFWLSIPWWIYILLIGAILIGFAMKNELKDKQNNNSKNKISEIKKYLDL